MTTCAVTVRGVTTGGLAKTGLREQALDVCADAVTSRVTPGASGRDRAPRRCRSPAARCGGVAQLSRRAFVEPSERGRLQVRTLSADEIGDMFEVRVHAGRIRRRPALQVREPTDPVVRQLQTALDALDAATGSINEMVEIDLEFHRTLCTLTGNTALLRSWEGIAGSIRMSIMFAGTDRALGNMSVPRHQVLVDAVAAGDPDKARIAVEEHMREAAGNLMTEPTTTERDTA